MNKQAIEFELEQAKGLYLPRITLEMSAGVRRLENSTRRALGIAGDELYPLEAGIRAEQTLIDFGRRRGEKLRQAARVDGAALRVVERSEEQTSELQSLMRISYAVFCLKKKNTEKKNNTVNDTLQNKK